MRLSARARGLAGLGLLLATILILVSLAGPPASAHNPAETIYHPVPVEDELLVVGGEGTWALLTPEGQTVERGNLSGDGEVIGPPVTLGDEAAVLVRSFPGLALHLKGFDAQGPTWSLELEPGEAEAFGFLAAGDGRFHAFTTEARHLTVTPQGDIAAEQQLPDAPATEPVPAARGGWWVPLADDLVRLEDGEVQRRSGYNATVTDVTTAEGHVLVSLAYRSERTAELLVLDAAGSLVFSRTLDGLRLGGSPAHLGEAIIVGTYDPDGARLVSLQAGDGEAAWERGLAGATAAAPAEANGTVLVATNDALTAYEPDGTQLWQREARPYLDSPFTVGELIVPSGSNNSLQALHGDGEIAWTWTDGVEMPSWSHHGGADVAGPEDGDEEEASDDVLETPSTGIGAALAAIAGLALGCAARRSP